MGVGRVGRRGYAPEVSEAAAPARLRVGYVPGVTLTKWRRIWSERFPRIPLDVVEVGEVEQREVALDQHFDLCFVRLPIGRDRLHLIPLYEEISVVVARRDHPIALFDEVTTAELGDELVIDTEHPDAIDLVAGGAGIMIVPQSVARTHSRRDLVHRPVTGADPTQIGLAWRIDDDNPLIEDFIGIVRGRTPNSSRSRTPEPAAPPRPAAPRPARRPRRRPGSGRRSRP